MTKSSKRNNNNTSIKETNILANAQRKLDNLEKKNNKCKEQPKMSYRYVNDKLKYKHAILKLWQDGRTA